MKKIGFYILISIFSATVFSCKKQGFGLYESGNYVQFVKHLNDSTMTSFLSLPNDNQILFPIAVELIGKPENKNRSFKILVIDSLTSAPAANYSIPGSFSLGANKVVDTAWITIKKTPGIALSPVKLVLKLAPSEELMVGQTEYSAAIIKISNMISQPQWWNSTVTGRYLGDYSDKKYRLFIQVTGVSEVNSADAAIIRAYAIEFKTYLLKEKEEGRTVYEENGTEMKVTHIGG